MGVWSVSSNPNKWTNWPVHCSLGWFLSRHDLWPISTLWSDSAVCNFRPDRVSLDELANVFNWHVSICMSGNNVHLLSTWFTTKGMKGLYRFWIFTICNNFIFIRNLIYIYVKQLSSINTINLIGNTFKGKFSKKLMDRKNFFLRT